MGEIGLPDADDQLFSKLPEQFDIFEEGRGIRFGGENAWDASHQQDLQYFPRQAISAFQGHVGIPPASDIECLGRIPIYQFLSQDFGKVGLDENVLVPGWVPPLKTIGTVELAAIVGIQYRCIS